MTAVTITEGRIVVDVDAWLAQRVGEHQQVMTDSLRSFISHRIFDGAWVVLSTEDRMRLWCLARGLNFTEPRLIRHDDQVLSSPVTVVLAAAATHTAYALVQVDGRPVDVLIDRTVDDDWDKTQSVDIMCPAAHTHAWTWPGGEIVFDLAGNVITIRDLFNDERSTPLRACHDCTAYENGDALQPCHCGQPVTIYCPICCMRCDLELTHALAIDRPQ